MKTSHLVIVLSAVMAVAAEAAIPASRLPSTGYWNPGCIGTNGQTYRQSGTFIPPIVLTNVINVRNAPYNAVGDGVHDDTTNIQAALSVHQDAVIYLPAGTYKITGQLELGGPIYPWQGYRRILRGDGPTNTFIMGYNTTGGPFIDASGSGPGTERAVTLAQLAPKGSTTVTLTSWDSAGFFDSQNWGILYQSNNVAGPPWSAGQNYEQNAKCQIIHIVARNSTAHTITFDTPAYFDWNTNTYFTIFYGWNAQVGVENLAIQNCSGMHTHNINFSGMFDSWVRNVQSIDAYNGHIRFSECARCDVLDCYIHGYYPANDGYVGGGNSDYGVWFFGQSSDNLAMNNFFDRTRHALIVEYGDTGNVFAYNYSQNSINEALENTDFQMETMDSHGCTQWNLWEGNVAGKFSMDDNLGGSIYNLGYRNYMSRQGLPTVTLGRWGYDIQVSNYCVSVIAGVIGNVNYSPTWREGAPNANGDIIGVQFPNPAGTPADPLPTMYMDGVIDLQSNVLQLTVTNLLGDLINSFPLPYLGLPSYPASLWLTAPPSFWGSTPWPAIGPDVSGYVSTIPAQTMMNNYPTNQWPGIPVAGTNAIVSAGGQSLVAWYPLAGNANDNSGTNTGALIGSPGFVTGVNGVAANALALNGSSQAVAMSGNSIFNSYCKSAGTFAAWVNGSDFSGGVIAYEAGETANNFGLAWPSGAGKPLVVNLGSNTGISGAKTNFSTGVFYHVAVTWDGTSTVKIYVNGVLDSTYAGSNTPNLQTDTTGTQLGRYSYGKGATAGGYFHGDIQDARIYNYALSASQISTLYNSVTNVQSSGVLSPPTQLKAQGF